MDRPAEIDPIALTIMAVNRLGPATFRTVSLGTAVIVDRAGPGDARHLPRRPPRDAEGAHHRPPHPYRARRGAMTQLGGVNRYRTIWISDIHLGTRGCKAEFLLDFLRYTEFAISLPRRRHRRWLAPQALLVLGAEPQRRDPEGAAQGAQGHQGHSTSRATTTNGCATIPSCRSAASGSCDEAVHVTADGRELLVIHGDAFDGVVRYAHWLALLGDWAYTRCCTINHYFNLVRRRFGYPYWSLSAYLKGQVKNAVEFVSDFADAIADEAHAARRRRHRLRPHPPGRDAPHRRRPLLQ